MCGSPKSDWRMPSRTSRSSGAACSWRKMRFREGATTRLDVTQGQSSLAQTEASLRPLEAARRQAVNQLCILMGMPPQSLDETLAGRRGIPERPAPGRGRHSGRTPPPSSGRAPGGAGGRCPKRLDRRRHLRVVSALSLNGTIFFDAQNFGDLFSLDSIAGHRRSLVPLGHPQLRTAGQQHPRAGVSLSTTGGPISKHRPPGQRRSRKCDRQLPQGPAANPLVGGSRGRRPPVRGPRDAAVPRGES